MPDPKLPLTVYRSIWEAVANAKGAPFADSYLSCAAIDGSVLTTHTTIAFDRIKAGAGSVLSALGLTIAKPLPFGHPSRRDSTDRVAAPGAWVPASDADYASMSLTDKIREHQILADDALHKAGPMFRNGKHLTPADMSPEWHRLVAKAANHHAEVKRLREKLADYREARA